MYRRIADTGRQGIEIDYCRECRSVWLDRGELDKIIEHSGGLSDIVVTRIIDIMTADARKAITDTTLTSKKEARVVLERSVRFRPRKQEPLVLVSGEGVR